MKLIALVLTFLIATPAYSCPKPVSALEFGEAAPCKGFLFSPKKEFEVRYKLLDYDFLVKEVEVKDKMLRLYKIDAEHTEQILNKERARTELWKDTSMDLSNKLGSQQRLRTTRDWVFFATGILTTLGAAWAVGQASK